MKKILVTLSLICFVTFISIAQTTPATTSKRRFNYYHNFIDYCKKAAVIMAVTV